MQAADGDRLRTILDYALKVNSDPAAVADVQVESLRKQGFTDKGIVQLTHVVSDFSSYNPLNLALDTEYDYCEAWKQLAGFATSA